MIVIEEDKDETESEIVGGGWRKEIPKQHKMVSTG